MALVTYEEFARATAGSRVGGDWYTFWHRDNPNPPAWPALDALELHSASCSFVLHRHRNGARKVRRILRRAKQARRAAYAADVARRFKAALSEWPDDMQRAPVPRILCGRTAMRDASLASPIPGEFYPVSPWALAPPPPPRPLTMARIREAFKDVYASDSDVHTMRLMPDLPFSVLRANAAAVGDVG